MSADDALAAAERTIAVNNERAEAALARLERELRLEREHSKALRDELVEAQAEANRLRETLIALKEERSA